MRSFTRGSNLRAALAACTVDRQGGGRRRVQNLELLHDLSALDHREPWYYGILAFGGSCTFQEECPGGASAAGCCGGRFAKALSPYPQQAARCSSGASCPMPHCAVGYGGSRAHHGSAQCPEVIIAPFAIGPIEVRSRPPARQIADCSRRPIFAALSRRRRAARRLRRGDAVQAQALTMRAIGATGRRDVAADELHGVRHEQGTTKST